MGLVFVAFFGFFVGLDVELVIVIVGFCFRVVVCEGNCCNYAKLDMFDVSKTAHVDLGFNNDVLRYMCA